MESRDKFELTTLLIMLALGGVVALVVMGTIGTDSERRRAQHDRSRWEQRAKYKPATSEKLIPPEPSLDEERAAEARLRRFKGHAPSNALIEAMPQ